MSKSYASQISGIGTWSLIPLNLADLILLLKWLPSLLHPFLYFLMIFLHLMNFRWLLWIWIHACSDRLLSFKLFISWLYGQPQPLHGGWLCWVMAGCAGSWLIVLSHGWLWVLDWEEVLGRANSCTAHLLSAGCPSMLSKFTTSFKAVFMKIQQSRL